MLRNFNLIGLGFGRLHFEAERGAGADADGNLGGNADVVRERGLVEVFGMELSRDHAVHEDGALLDIEAVFDRKRVFGAQRCRSLGLHRDAGRECPLAGIDFLRDAGRGRHVNERIALPGLHFEVDAQVSGPAKGRPFDFDACITRSTVGMLYRVRATAHVIGGRTPSHRSDRCVQLILVLKGRLHVTVRNETKTLEKDSLLLKDSSDPFLLVVGKESEWFGVIVPVDYFRAHTSVPVHAYYGSVIELQSPAERLLRNAMMLTAHALDALDARDAGDVCDGLLCLMRPALMRCFREAREDSTVTRHERLRREAINVMIKRMARPGTTIDEIARACGVSARLLTMVFRETGTTPAAQFMALRLEHAKVYLTEAHTRDLKIEEIAKTCGFRTASHFSRAFRKTYGVSPREMRERTVLD